MTVYDEGGPLPSGVTTVCGGSEPEVVLAPGKSNACVPYCGRSAEPDGYLQWHDWARRMANRGYTQSRCPKCGLYTIWSQ